MTASALPSRKIVNVIELRRNRPMVSSLKIAELFERRHDSVLRAIRTVKETQGDLRIDAEMSSDAFGSVIPEVWRIEG